MTSPIMEKQQHTPTPWYVGAQNDALYITAGVPPAQSNDYPNHTAERIALAHVYSEANARHIVRCVNAHDSLVAALERIAAIENRDFGPDWEEIEEAREIARAALKQAEGQ